jgi:hypothetical protein
VLVQCRDPQVDGCPFGHLFGSCLVNRSYNPLRMNYLLVFPTTRVTKQTVE